MNMSRIIIFILAVLTLISYSCNNNPVITINRPPYSNKFTGKVILQNQIENSNALIYIDNLNRGVSSDSSGNYIFPFNQSDSIYNGEYKVRYFLDDYDMDSARIILVRGKLKLDTLDVDCEGKIKTKELKQIVLIEGWTDKQEYKRGDKITFTARITNISDRKIHFAMDGFWYPIGIVYLYNDKYRGFLLSPYTNIDPLVDAGGDLSPKGYYEGTVTYTLLNGYNDGSGFHTLISDKYIVVTNFFIEGRLLDQFRSKFNYYALIEWYKIIRGLSPRYDYFPNKFKFPVITIVD